MTRKARVSVCPYEEPLSGFFIAKLASELFLFERKLIHDRLVQAKFIDRAYCVDPSLLELIHKTYAREVGIERYYVTLVDQGITQS